MSAEGGPDAESGARAFLADRIGRTLLTSRAARARPLFFHRSYVAENAGELPNERLEFFGDAVLGLIVTDYLVRKYPDLPEGDLSRFAPKSSAWRCRRPVAAEIGVGDALLFGSPAKSSPVGGRRHRSSPTRWRRSSPRRTCLVGSSRRPISSFHSWRT